MCVLSHELMTEDDCCLFSLGGCGPATAKLAAARPVRIARTFIANDLPRSEDTDAPQISKIYSARAVANAQRAHQLVERYLVKEVWNRGRGMHNKIKKLRPSTCAAQRFEPPVNAWLTMANAAWYPRHLLPATDFGEESQRSPCVRGQSIGLSISGAACCNHILTRVSLERIAARRSFQYPCAFAMRGMNAKCVVSLPLFSL